MKDAIQVRSKHLRLGWGAPILGVLLVLLSSGCATTTKVDWYPEVEGAAWSPREEARDSLNEGEKGLLTNGYARIGQMAVTSKTDRSEDRLSDTVNRLLSEAAEVGGDIVDFTQRKRRGSMNKTYQVSSYFDPKYVTTTTVEATILHESSTGVVYRYEPQLAAIQLAEYEALQEARAEQEKAREEQERARVAAAQRAAEERERQRAFNCAAFAGDLAERTGLTLTPGTDPVVILETNVGDMAIRLFPDLAPRNCLDLILLCSEGTYDGAGLYHAKYSSLDSLAIGNGLTDRDYELEDEYSDRPQLRGHVGVIRKGRHTHAFDIWLEDRGRDERYTVIGEVVRGLDEVMAENEKIEKSRYGMPATDNFVNSVEIAFWPREEGSASASAGPQQ